MSGLVSSHRQGTTATPRPEPVTLYGPKYVHRGTDTSDESRKSYMAAHPTWRSPDADTSCPRCGLEPETFEHTILSCLSRQGARSRLLHSVRSVGHKAPLSSCLPLLKSLATFISVTSTGFPPTMFPPDTPPSSPPLPLLPIAVPSPLFCVFALAEV